MDDMATFDPNFDPGMTVSFISEELGEINFGSGTVWPTYPSNPTYPNIYTPEVQGDLEINHVIEEEEGLVGYTEDGTRVLLGDWVPTAVSMRVRALLERIAAGDELDESDLEKFCYLKRLLELQQEELENTANRIQFIEQLIAL